TAVSVVAEVALGSGVTTSAADTAVAPGVLLLLSRLRPGKKSPPPPPPGWYNSPVPPAPTRLPPASPPTGDDDDSVAPLRPPRHCSRAGHGSYRRAHCTAHL